MLFKTQSAAVYGIDANIIEVEVDIGTRQLEKENFQTVGLPDTAVREARDRVRPAILNSGFEFPQLRITANLAPAFLRKVGCLAQVGVAGYQNCRKCPHIAL